MTHGVASRTPKAPAWANGDQNGTDQTQKGTKGAGKDRKGGGKDGKQGDPWHRGQEPPTHLAMWGLPLTPKEIDKAKEKAPVDKDGTLICWGYLTHMGCANAGCKRAHERLSGKVTDLDPTVQMQLLRRGGLRWQKMPLKADVQGLIKAIRTKYEAELASKAAEGRQAQQQRAGGAQGCLQCWRMEAGKECLTCGRKAAGELDLEGISPHANLGKRVHFDWKPPEELLAIDFTKGEEETRQLAAGPDPWWAYHRPRLTQAFSGEPDPSTVPAKAKELVARAAELARGPILQALVSSSDDLFAYAAARAAADPSLDLVTILEDCATYGLGDLAAESAAFLDELPAAPTHKAGELQEVTVGNTAWPADGQPGEAQATINGQS
jgi:hypothetical protein